VARFLNHMVGEDVQVFWAALQRGEFITDAAAAAGMYRKQGTRWVMANGGVRPRRGRNVTGRFLSFAEREEIALARAAGESIRGIAHRLGRSPSTVSRELRRNAQAPGLYRATSAHAAAWVRASRPKPAKLATNLVLRELVERYLLSKYSPEQIAGRATVAARLKDIAEHAATAVAQVAADATRTITDQHDHADRETRVATARQRLAETAAATPGDGPTILDATGAHQDWVTAIENLVPATTAADRAAEAAAARATSINRSLTTQSRHPSAETLLRATNGTDSTRG